VNVNLTYVTNALLNEKFMGTFGFCDRMYWVQK